MRHMPCSSCGSSDACAVYESGFTHCFSCGNTHVPPELRTKRRRRSVTTEPREESITESRRLAPLIEDLSFQALTKRGLTEETCRLWGYGIGNVDGEDLQVACYRDEDGIVAQKVRTRDKDFLWRGKHKKGLLFGRHGSWCRDGGKKLVITEGEIDAMSVSQVQDHKWPVVSISSGANGAKHDIAANIEWLEKFDEVIFMFDMDEPGQKAARECCDILTPGRGKIAQLPLKDANELLKAGRGKDIISAIWSAREYRPDGVVAGADLWDRISTARMADSLNYPWLGLQKKTLGARCGEIVVVGAGTGVGKSEFVRQIVSHFHDEQADRIGYIALEESVERTALGLMGLYLQKRIHLDPDKTSEADKKRAFAATVGSGRYFLYDHWGSTESDNLLSKIRFMARGAGCKTIVLDHISIVVSGLDIDDERKAIDVTMTRLRSLVQELKIRLYVVVHLKRIEGDSHEEGGRVELSHFRGSGSIAQLADLAIGLERNQQSEDENENVTRVRVLKNRFSGDLGIACYLKYDRSTGRMGEVEAPKKTESQSDGKEFGY